MWVFLNNAFLSIVAHREQPDAMLVRARLPGDIERVFPDADVSQTPEADYLFRATIHRSLVADALAKAVRGIDYHNFKASVVHDERKRLGGYYGVWNAMHAIQPTTVRSLDERRRFI